MEERVPPDGKDDPPPPHPPLESPSFKKYPLPRPPRRSNSNTVRKDPRLTKSEDSFSFSFPLPPSSSHEIEPDALLNNATSRLFHNNTPLISSLPPPPDDGSLETYIVQVPKEQIFRVPPPENARILESLGRPDKKKCAGNRCLWIFIALVIIGLIAGLGVLVLHLLYNPKSPHFSITNIHVINPPPSHRQHPKPEFQISLLVGNPNERMRIVYKSGGESSLSFKNHVIGKGIYPSSSQEKKNSMTVQVMLPGSDAALPPEIQNSLNDTKSKTELSFGLTIQVPIQFTSWMKPTKEDLSVSCDFKVNTLAKGSKILDQQCTR